MAKCFITGVELPLEETYLLDIGPAFRALRDLRKRAASLERLVEQLSPVDDVEVYNPQKHETTSRKDRRLISPSVANALSDTYPEGELFVTWPEWRSRRPYSKGTRSTTADVKETGLEQPENGYDQKSASTNNRSQGYSPDS